MRTSFLMAAGAALLMAACGGGEKPAQQQTTADTTAQAAPAPAGTTAAPATGTVHDVNMELNGSTYEFSPANLTIKQGDVVKFHNVSGGPHNVEFYPDSIPAGAADVLNSAMADRTGPLAGPLLVEPNAVYTISFAGAPTGEYKYYCLPHHALGMKGTITVEQ